MSSKELVPVAGKELATLDDASPCPAFDAKVRAIVLEIDQLARNHDVFPNDRKVERDHFDYQLRSLVDAVDSGLWSDQLPKRAAPKGEVETQILASGKRLIDMDDEEFNRLWDSMSLADKFARIDSDKRR